MIGNLNACEVQKTKLIIGKEDKCTGMEQRHAAKKLNIKNTLEEYNNHNPSLTQSLLHTQSIKIYHQNIRSLEYKMNELLCHLNHDPPHILCITEHHLHHEELSFLHVENYVLGSCYCWKSNKKVVSVYL